MDVQLQELIDKIKRDGVATAETSAQKIVTEAEDKAASIIKEAEAKADSIIKNAKAETERMEKASEDAIEQAGRNLIISFREGINREISALVTAEAEKAFDKDLLKKLIPETVKAWVSSKSGENDLSVLLPAKDLKALESTVKTALKSQISKGLVIKGDDSLNSGFRIGTKDGRAFYDFSADEVAGLFSSYLNPRTTQLMMNAAKGIPSERVEFDSSDEEEKPVAKRPGRPASKTTAKTAAKTTTARKTAAKGKK